MSLLDVDETMKELTELDYLLYDNFVDYLSKHVPKKLWDHSIQRHANWRTVSYTKFMPPIRIDKHEGPYNENMVVAVPTVNEHLCIHITPTDDGLVNIEFPKYIPKYIYSTFPILIGPNERVPKTILKLFEPLKDKLEIIKGWL